MTDATLVALITTAGGGAAGVIALLIKRHFSVQDARLADRDSFCEQCYGRLYADAFAFHEQVQRYIQFKREHPESSGAIDLMWWDIEHRRAPVNELSQKRESAPEEP